MNPAKQEIFTSYLDQRTAALQTDAIRLVKDNRTDEANFEKIRANIFQIIKTLFLARQNASETEREAFIQSRLILFEETWKAALTKAETHNDHLRVRQEQAKLEALEEIRNRFEQLREVTT